MDVETVDFNNMVDLAAVIDTAPYLLNVQDDGDILRVSNVGLAPKSSVRNYSMEEKSFVSPQSQSVDSEKTFSYQPKDLPVEVNQHGVKFLPAQVALAPCSLEPPPKQYHNTARMPTQSPGVSVSHGPYVQLDVPVNRIGTADVGLSSSNHFKSGVDLSQKYPYLSAIPPSLGPSREEWNTHRLNVLETSFLQSLRTSVLEAMLGKCNFNLSLPPVEELIPPNQYRAP